MKVHITKAYNFWNKRIGAIQATVADVARSIGFVEMGIFNYDVNSDSHEELGKRLDGIIAAVEPGDIVIIQLPTGNGINFEKRLIAKIKGYPNTKVIMIFHGVESYESLDSFNGVDKIIYRNSRMLKEIHSKGLGAPIEEQFAFSNCNENVIKRNLLDISDFFDSSVYTGNEAEDNLIHAAFGLYDKNGGYTLYVGEAIQSVLENTNEKICFHIFHDETLTSANMYRLKKTVSFFGSYVQFHKMNGVDFESDNKWVKYYTIGAMFRLVMPRVLDNLHKLIYLDADLMFNRDIKELWNIDIKDYSLAAVKDVIFDNGIVQPKFVKEGIVPKDRYFNSGLLIMNLDKIRQRGDLLELALEFLNNNPDSALPDQDALNYYFNSTTLFLDKSWNVFTQYEKKRTSEITDNVVYHFMGQPLIDYSGATDFEKLYYNMKAKTAWGYAGIESEVFRGYTTLTAKIVNSQGLITAMVANKKKIYYGYHTEAMENLLKIIPPCKGDYFVTDDKAEYNKDIMGLKYRSINYLENETKGEFVVLVLPLANNGRAIDNLKSMGLVELEDYYVIPKLLVGPAGGYWG